MYPPRYQKLGVLVPVQGATCLLASLFSHHAVAVVHVLVSRVSLVDWSDAVGMGLRAGYPTVFSVNYFCRPIASPENVTEILALISHSNQD